MRLVKMFGLAAIAAVAAMAFVASSAMAGTELEEVVVCKLQEDPCALDMHFGAGTILHGELVSGTKAVLLSSTPIECSESTTLGEITELLAHGKITALTFSSCETNTGVGCTVTAENLNYLVKGLLNDAHNGYHVVVSSGGVGQPQAEVTCGKIIKCKYGETSVLLTAEPNANDTVLSVLQELTGVGLLCGTIAHPVWHAKYLTRCLDTGNLVGCWLAMEHLPL